MDAELITTGTEILLGEIVDTNAAWLARRLRDLGINLYYKTSVGDNLERIAAVMRQALGRSDVVLVTGGLGPTVDDVTRDAAALATDRALVLNAEALAWIEAIFARWGRQVLDNNRRQAFMPEASTPVPNPVGTAPGFVVEVARVGRAPTLLICLPGVPREMKHLMQETVEPLLAERLGPDRLVIKAKKLRTVGIGESAIDARIPDLMMGLNPTVGLAAHLGQVDVRITARAGTEAVADSMIADVEAQIRERLGRFVYGEDEESLEEVVLRQLHVTGQRLALLETNTGGEVGERLGAVPGGEDVLSAHVVWTDSDLVETGPWAAEVAPISEAGAEAAARWLLAGEGGTGASLALALCGTLDPAAGPYGAYRGETFMALASPAGLVRHRIDVGGTGELARRWAGNAALNRLRQWLTDGE